MEGKNMPERNSMLHVANVTEEGKVGGPQIRMTLLDVPQAYRKD